MKKMISFLLTCTFLFCLTACAQSVSDKNPAKEGLSPYELSESEEHLLESFGMSDTSQIFSFCTPAEVITINANVYRLSNNNTWELNGGVSLSSGSDRIPEKQSNGTFAIQQLDNYRLQLNINYAGHCSSISAPVELEKDFLAAQKVFLQDFQEIELHKEIPVALIVYSGENHMPAYTLSDFYEPQKFEKTDLVQAVTLKFSDKEL